MEQINFDYKIIKILKNKGNKKTQIPFLDTLYLECLKIRDDEGYIFVNPETGEPYKDIKKSFRAAKDKADINDFRFHDLRHTIEQDLLKDMLFTG